MKKNKKRKNNNNNSKTTIKIKKIITKWKKIQNKTNTTI